MLERGSGIKADTNNLQISFGVSQTHAVLLLAKHIWHTMAHRTYSSIAGSDATPCELIFTRTGARLPFLCLPLTNTLFQTHLFHQNIAHTLQHFTISSLKYLTSGHAQSQTPTRMCMLLQLSTLQ